MKDRVKFAKGENKPKGIIHSEFTNTIHVKYVEIIGADGNIVCDYVEPLYIEKATNGYDFEDVHEWRPDPRWQTTGCLNCYRIVNSDPPPQSVIKVDNSKDMLPLYMKWALKLGGAKFDEDGWIDDESYGKDGLKLHETLSKLYENINGRHRLRKFSEHKCDKCKKEWIVFDKEDKIEEQ